MKYNRSAFVKAVAVAGVALAALGTASVAEARGNVFFSIGANIAPGVSLGVSNAYYPQYYQPAPVYYQPAPVYYQPYYQPAVYYAPPLVTYVGPYGYGYGYGHGYRNHGHRGR